MKFLWFDIETKKELRDERDELNKEYYILTEKHELLKKQFPLVLGQTVYDVALRSAEGKYTKKNPSRDHSCVTAVVVDKKNYFSLVDRINRNDVFLDDGSANKHLDAICK